MADDRPLEDLAAAVGRIDAAQADFQSTVLARLSQSPTGTFGWTLATVAPPGTVLLQGQVLQEAAYPALHAWVSAHAPGGFSVTATTVTLPNLQGKVLRGVAVGETAGQAIGSDTRTLITANLPAHDHNVSGSTNSAGSHTHSGSTDASGGNHGGHFPGDRVLVPEGNFYGVATWNGGAGNVAHAHNMDLNDAGSHTHGLSISESIVGSGTAIDLRQAGVAVNYLVWT